MDDLGVFHIRYLESRLNKIKKEDLYNKEQIQFYERVLITAKKSKTYEEYTTALGKDADFFPLAKAEALDRNRSFSEIYQKLGFAFEVKEYEEQHIKIENSDNYVSLAKNVSLTQNPFSREGTHFHLNSTNEFLSLVYLIGSEPTDELKRFRALQANTIYETIKNKDPNFQFESLKSLPYSHINCYTDSQLDELESLFRNWI